jgi:putative MFS transporter
LVAKAAEGNWRVLLALPAISGSVAFGLLCCMPESVRWLFVSDRQDDGYTAIRGVLSSMVIMGPDPQVRDPPHIIVPEAKAHADRTVWMQLSSLLGNEWKQTTIIASLLFIATAGASYATLMWTPHTVMKLSGAETHMYELFIWVEVVGLLSLLAVSSIVDWVGRRSSYVISAIAAAICEATLPWTITSGSDAAIYANLLSKAFFMSINWTAMLTYIAEAFPTPLRGSGAGCAACLGRLSAALVPIAVGALLEVSATWAFCLIAVILLAGALAAVFMPHEMANSKLSDTV